MKIIHKIVLNEPLLLEYIRIKCYQIGGKIGKPELNKIKII